MGRVSDAQATIVAGQHVNEQIRPTSAPTCEDQRAVISDDCFPCSTPAGRRTVEAPRTLCTAATVCVAPGSLFTVEAIITDCRRGSGGHAVYPGNKERAHRGGVAGFCAGLGVAGRAVRPVQRPAATVGSCAGDVYGGGRPRFTQRVCGRAGGVQRGMAASHGRAGCLDVRSGPAPAAQPDRTVAALSGTRCNSLHRHANATHASLLSDEADAAVASQAIHDVVIAVRTFQPLPPR
jgi:hypothetical protein